jgi:multidrug efflux pump subunit AcrB
MKPKNTAERWLNPVMITLIYLVLGFFFNLWHPGWMIFLASPVAAVLNGKPTKS